MIEVPSILITDDDAAFRETLRDVFAPRGIDTRLAGDGMEALEIVHESRIDLILLDMHMPRLTGLETIRQLRQEDRQIPCILMSARMDENLAEQAEAEAVFSVLSKPMSFTEVTGVVFRALQVTYGWASS